MLKTVEQPFVKPSCASCEYYREFYDSTNDHMITKCTKYKSRKRMWECIADKLYRRNYTSYNGTN